MKTRHWTLALLLAAASSLAFPADEACCAAPQAQSANGIAYISGGIGEDERTALTAAAAGYNLKLVFADRSGGHFLSDVKVGIRNAKGEPVLDAVSDGPWFFVKLPPGSYRVSAAAEDKSLTRGVTVGKGKAKTLQFAMP